jgi:hypothetical protein
MKKITFILVLLVTMFAILGCPNVGGGGGGSKGGSSGGGGTGGGTGGGGGNNTPATRKFWAQNAVTKAFYQLDADRLASSSRCEVWVEKGSGVTAATANSVASAYGTVYTKMMNTFGYQANVDLGGSVKKMNTMEIAHWLATGETNGAKLTILLLDIKDGYNTGDDPYVGGYFHSINFIENDPNDALFKYSNALDMIYLDTYPSVPGSQESNGTLAHEMQHLMNFVTTVGFRTTVMDIWIDEGLSAAAEWVYSGKHPEGRWKYYNEDYSGLIKKGNNFYVWGNRDDNPLANLDDYATVYLFFQYLRLQSGNPGDIYIEILTSNFSDYRAVTTAADIYSTHKNNWSLLLRDWHAANFTNASSGPYGYKNDSTLKGVKAPMVPAGTTSLPLYPGEGVYSRTTTAESVPSTSGFINYTGLSSSGAAPNNTTGFANGARLTYNVNTDTKSTSASGSTTGIAPSVGISVPGSGSVQTASKKFSGPFKVDMGYFNRRNGNGGVPDNAIKRAFKNNGGSIDKSNNTVTFDISTLERVFIDE